MPYLDQTPTERSLRNSGGRASLSATAPLSRKSSHAANSRRHPATLPQLLVREEEFLPKAQQPPYEARNSIQATNSAERKVRYFFPVTFLTTLFTAIFTFSR